MTAATETANAILERTCKNPGCTAGDDGGPKVFTPRKKHGLFCSTECRHAFHKTAARWQVHACPLCSALHDPEETAVLDALERTINSYVHDTKPTGPTLDPRVPPPGSPTGAGLLKTVEDFIERRRKLI